MEINDNKKHEDHWDLVFGTILTINIFVFLVPFREFNFTPFVIGWGIFSIGSFAVFLFRKLSCKRKILWLVLPNILIVHIAAGVLAIALKSEYQPKEREVAIGHFVKKDGNEFVYNIRRSDGKYDVVRVEVDHEYITNNSAYFQQIRKVVLLRTNPGKIIEWEPSLKQINDFKYAVKYRSTIDDELIGVNSFDFAKDHPRIYFENFGIDVVCKAKVKYIENDYCTVVYNTIYGDQKETYFECKPSKIKGSDSILISITIKPDTIIAPSFFGLIEDYPTFNSICFSFPDTLLSAEKLGKNIPQFNDYLFYSRSENANNKLFASIGYFMRMNVYPGGNGTRHYSPIYLLRDLDGNSLEIEIDTLLSASGEMDFKDSVCLIEACSKKIRKRRLSQSDYEKYKFPIQILYGGIEIGNNSYGYAKYEPEKYVKNFGVTLCYSAKVMSSSEVDGSYNLRISFKDNNGAKYDETIRVSETDVNLSNIIVYRKSDNFYPVESQFQTEYYYDKLKDSFGFLFKDTIVTKTELVNDIPSISNSLKRL